MASKNDFGKKNLKDIVYDSILESIYSSEYLPEQILTETDLIKRFGFSKSPIREALSALCHEGVLRNIPRCGYQVITLTSEDIEQIQQYRIILESGLMQAGFPYMDKPYFDKLEKLSVLCHQHTENILIHWIYNRDFHLALASASGNDYAYTQLSNTMMVLYRAYAQIHWRTAKCPLLLNDMKYHDKIIQALKEKDLDSALAYLREDFGDFGSRE